jgi:hypothetical protein
MDDLKTGVEFLKCLKKEKDRISRPIGNKEYLTYIDLPGYLEILENF